MKTELNEKHLVVAPPFNAVWRQAPTDGYVLGAGGVHNANDSGEGHKNGSI